MNFLLIWFFTFYVLICFERANAASDTVNNDQSQTSAIQLIQISKHAPKMNFSIPPSYVSFKLEPHSREGNGKVTNVSNDEPEKSTTAYPPFKVIKSFFGLTTGAPDYKLPSNFVKIGEEWKLQAGSLYIIEFPLCPELKTNSEEAIAAHEIIVEKFPISKNCLFKKDFEESGEEMCEKEPQISLEISKDNKGLPITCGLHEHQQLINVGYYNCGTVQDLIRYDEELREETKTASFTIHPHIMYQVCFDSKLRDTLWTKHNLMTEALLGHEHSPYKSDSFNKVDNNEFSTDISTLQLDPSIFAALKTFYQSPDSNTNIIYTLVPKEHMALPYWKKATTHMINAAPLSQKLLPLIKAIDNGIFLASHVLFSALTKKLKIYTAVKRFETKTKVSKLEKMTAIFQSLRIATPHSELKPNVSDADSAEIDFFTPNIWYKLVYNETDKSGVLIVLHNTNKEVQINRECKENKALPCDFDTWSKVPFTADDQLSLTYAYCCPISTKRIKELFSIKELKIKKPFKIQEFINMALKLTQLNNVNNADKESSPESLDEASSSP